MLFVFMCFIFFGGIVPTVSGNLYIIDNKDGVHVLVKATSNQVAEVISLIFFFKFTNF